MFTMAGDRAGRGKLLVPGAGLFSGQFSAVPTMASTGLNANTAGTYSTAPADTAAGIFFTSTSAGGSYTAGVPQTPYGLTILMSFLGTTSITQGPRFGWTDGTKYQGYLLAFSGVGAQLSIQNLSGLNVFASTAYGPESGPFNYVWLKLHDDGTNFSFGQSVDGVNFTTLLSGAKSGGYLGSTGYSHFFVSCAGNGIGTVMSWQVGS